MPIHTDASIKATLPSKLAQRRRENNPHSRHIVLEGMLIGKPEGYTFDPNYPYTYCRVCGAVYQTDLERKQGATPAEQVQSVLNRRNWSFSHSESHPISVHQEMAASGRYMTPEAAQKLIPLGIIPVSDMILNDEVEQAAGEAPRLNDKAQDEMEALQ